MTSRPKITRSTARGGLLVLQSAIADGANGPDMNMLRMLLDGWKKEHCAQLGHPLELREGYAVFCMCGERFGAVTPEQAGEESDG